MNDGLAFFKLMITSLLFYIYQRGSLSPRSQAILNLSVKREKKNRPFFCLFFMIITDRGHFGTLNVFFVHSNLHIEIIYSRRWQNQSFSALSSEIVTHILCRFFCSIFFLIFSLFHILARIFNISH